MGIQEEFDRCYAFQTGISGALSSVRESWTMAVSSYASDLAAEPQEGWQDWLDALAPTFAADHLPAGLDAEQEAAYLEECGAIEDVAKRRIRQLATEEVGTAGQKRLYLEGATEHLTEAKAAYQGGDVLGGEWLVDVMIGCHLGLLAGGADAFPAGADRTLFQAAIAFARSNAAELLEVIDTTAERPSDAVGLSTFRAARERLQEFVQEAMAEEEALAEGAAAKPKGGG